MPIQLYVQDHRVGHHLDSIPFGTMPTAQEDRDRLRWITSPEYPEMQRQESQIIHGVCAFTFAVAGVIAMIAPGSAGGLILVAIGCLFAFFVTKIENLRLIVTKDNPSGLEH